VNTLRQETALNVLGVDARAFAVIAESSGRIRNQTIKATRYYKEHGHEYRITAELRFDDECKNGHETFAVTADIREDGREYAGGCCHDEIAKHFPEWAPLIKWHLCSTDGPMHYLANTTYHADEHGHTHAWVYYKAPQSDPLGIGEDRERLLSYCKRSIAEQAEGKSGYRVQWDEKTAKVRNLDHARSSAIWPEATDAELCAPDLRGKLVARLPALMSEFKAAMLGAGFLWPEVHDQKQAA
jgi:hypothetical protein